MRVLFLDEVHEVLAERLTDAGFDCEFALTEDLDTCRSMAQYADGLVIRSRFKMDESFLKNANNIRFIARSGAGMENIDEVYCKENNILLTIRCCFLYSIPHQYFPFQRLIGQ